MREIRLNGIVLRPTAKGWQVGEVGTRKREGVEVEHLVRPRYFSHTQLPKACGVFASMATARGADVPDIGALVKGALEVEVGAHAAVLRPARKRKPDGPRICLRLSPDDRTRIAEAAQARGITPTEFVRGAVLEKVS